MPPAIDSPRPFLEHIIELRQRLIVCAAVFAGATLCCYFYADDIFKILVQPLSDILHDRGQDRRLIYTGLTEAFTTYLKLSMFGGAFLSFPVLAIQIWKFVVPALYKHERKIFIPLLMGIPVLFIVGALFAYYFIFPMAYTFFLSFESPGSFGSLPIQLEAKVNEYLSFVMRLIMSFGVCFELPILLTLLSTIGVVSAQGLMDKWRIAVVIIFAVSALITPPDILSMVGLAVPLIVLYGLSIFLVKLAEQKRKKNAP
jgi:sec-independent protein translocase protein TatC